MAAPSSSAASHDVTRWIPLIVAIELTRRSRSSILGSRQSAKASSRK